MARKRPHRPGSGSRTASPTAGARKWKIAVELSGLEMASGHDGFCRGKPDPAILVGAFFVATAETPRVIPLGRVLVRFVPRGKLPLSVSPPLKSVLKARASGSDGDRLVLLAIALEEDAGSDVERVYASLADGALLRVWQTAASEPSPASLGELVQVIAERDDLRDLCTADEFVGAGIVVTAPRRSEDAFRVRFVSGDARNDWTAIVVVKIDG
jgi:hypothetical protein